MSLTSIYCKTLEHVLHSISLICTVLCDHQHGFRENCSCKAQLIGAVHDFAMYLNEGGHIDTLA